MLLNHGCNINGIPYNSESNGIGCNISRKCPHANLGSLHLAAYLGRKDIVELLYRRGADKAQCCRVYTSAVIDCPPNFQLDILSSNVSQEAAEMSSKCGSREAVFFAVLGDHADIVRALLCDADPRDQARKTDSSHSYLVHLACRVGAYLSLCYLVDLYPSAILSPDADGLLPLVMGIKHGLRFVDLLIQRGADIHALDNLWQDHTNILHLLYKTLPFSDMDLVPLTHVTRVCLEHGVHVNAQREPQRTSPLHELLAAVNIPASIHLLHPDRNPADTEDKLRKFDRDIVSCVQCLLDAGVDVQLADSNGRSPLQILLTNGNHTVRLNAALKYQTPPHVTCALALNSYGLENTLKITRILLEHGASNKPNILGSTPLRDLTELMCSSYFGSDFWAWTHSLEILNIHEMLEGYCDIIRILLQHDCDPNATPEDQQPPLLYLLSHIADSPYSEDYVIPMATARSISAIMQILLASGANTECETETKRSIPRVTGCFDLLMSILEKMQDFPHSRSANDLGVIHLLALPLIQHGARTVVYHKLMYGDPGSVADVPWCYCIPTHSFLYQLLQFGALNLHHVTSDDQYGQLVATLVYQADHYTLHEVLNTVYLQFSAMHQPGHCSCSDCPAFFSLLLTYLHKPRSLKQICRLTVINSFHGLRPAAIDVLSLPSSLKEYLLSFQP